MTPRGPSQPSAPRLGAVDRELQALAAPSVAAGELRPALRRDLVVAPGRGETLTVKAPGSLTAFPLYKLEWGIAQLMNGERTLAQIAAEAARIGVAATPDLVRAFARELAGYGFLQSAAEMAAALRASGPAEVQPTSDEERELLRTAVAMQGKGDIDAAISYLWALLEINPGNRTARALLRECEEEPRVARDDEVQAARRPWVRRIALGATAVVLAGALGAGLLLWRRAGGRGWLPPWAGAGTAASRGGRALAGGTVHVRVQVHPAAGQALRTPMPGNVRREVPEGALVGAGDTVAVVYKSQGYAQLARAEAAYRRAEASGRGAVAQKKRYEQVRERVKQQSLRAPAAGAVHHLVEDGAAVADGAAVVEVRDASVLTGSVPVALVPFAAAGVACEARRPGGGPALPCTAAVEAPAGATPVVRVTARNPGKALAPDEWLEVDLTASKGTGRGGPTARGKAASR